jgi:hypothetical protein
VGGEGEAGYTREVDRKMQRMERGRQVIHVRLIGRCRGWWKDNIGVCDV